MRRAEREIKDSKLVEETLLRAQYVHLGLWDGRTPYVVPVSFGYEAGALYFHGSYKGKKAECLRACDRVCFEAVVEYALKVDAKACEYTAHFRSVIGRGRASFVEDPAQKRRALDIIMRHYEGPEGKWDDKVLAVTAVIRVDVEELTGKANPPLE